MAVLKADKREGTGKYVAFDMRKEGVVPAVVYGKGAENINIAINEKEFKAILKSGARILELEIDGKQVHTIVKDVQHSNLGDDILHADFRIIDEHSTLHIEVEVVLKGEAAGIELGGVVEQDLHRVQIECHPSELPEVVELDVSGLGVGQVLYVKDLPEFKGVTYRTPEGVAVVSCHGKSAADEEEAAAEEAAAESEA